MQKLENQLLLKHVTEVIENNQFDDLIINVQAEQCDDINELKDKLLTTSVIGSIFVSTDIETVNLYQLVDESRKIIDQSKKALVINASNLNGFSLLECFTTNGVANKEKSAKEIVASADIKLINSEGYFGDVL